MCNPSFQIIDIIEYKDNVLVSMIGPLEIFLILGSPLRIFIIPTSYVSWALILCLLLKNKKLIMFFNWYLLQRKLKKNHGKYSKQANIDDMGSFKIPFLVLCQHIFFKEVEFCGVKENCVPTYMSSMCYSPSTLYTHQIATAQTQ